MLSGCLLLRDTFLKFRITFISLYHEWVLDTCTIQQLILMRYKCLLLPNTDHLVEGGQYLVEVDICHFLLINCQIMFIQIFMWFFLIIFN